MKKTAGVLLLGFVGAVPSFALAAEGPYIGLSLSYSDMQQGCSLQPSDCDKTSQVLRFQGGYQFSPRWGIELGYGSLGEATLPSGAKASAKGVDVALMLLSPTFEEKLKGMVKLGLLNGKLDNGFNGKSATSSKVIWGVGLMYQASQDVSIRALYEDFSFVGDTATGQTDIKLFTVGMAVGF